MKKLLLFIAFTVLSYGAAHSQEFRIGAKAGLNISTIGGDFTDGLDPHISFHVGGLVEIPLAGKFALQPELLYSSQGANYNTFFGFGANYDSRLTLNYINLPIMGKYYIVKGLSVELGPQIGFLVSAKSKYDNKYGKENLDVKGQYKTIDFSIGIGASYRLNNSVFFSLRFNKGIININEPLDYSLFEGGEPIDGYYGNYKQHNNVLQISAGYSF